MSKDLYTFKKIEALFVRAEQGDAEAQYDIGECYYNGYGVDTDYRKAFELWKELAEKEDDEAQCAIGICFYNGQGVDEDYFEAEKWLKCSLNQGNVVARDVYNDLIKTVYISSFEILNADSPKDEAADLYIEGVCFIEGYDEEINYPMAIERFLAAARLGHTDAQFIVGVAYEKGMGIEQNIDEAVKWYRLAAEQGHARAQCNLGICYKNGYGVEKNDIEALKWVKRAADQGDEKAKKLYQKWL